MGWRKRGSKAQVFQDSFPKTESTEILTTFVGNGVSERGIALSLNLEGEMRSLKGCVLNLNYDCRKSKYIA